MNGQRWGGSEWGFFHQGGARRNPPMVSFALVLGACNHGKWVTTRVTSHLAKSQAI